MPRQPITPATSDIKRPPNSWIIYRSDAIKRLPPVQPGQPRRTQAEASRIIAKAWSEETPKVKDEYQRRAEIKYAEHRKMYPDYSYHPVKKADKQRLRAEQKEKRIREGLVNSQRNALYNAAHVPVARPSASSASTSPSAFTFLDGCVAPSPPLSDASSEPPTAVPWNLDSAPGDWPYPVVLSTTHNASNRISSRPPVLSPEPQYPMPANHPPLYNNATQATGQHWRTNEVPAPRLIPATSALFHAPDLPFGSSQKIDQQQDRSAAFYYRFNNEPLPNQQAALAMQSKVTPNFGPPEPIRPSANLGGGQEGFRGHQSALPDVIGWNSWQPQTEQSFMSRPIVNPPAPSCPTLPQPLPIIPQVDTFSRSFIQTRGEGPNQMASRSTASNHGRTTSHLQANQGQGDLSVNVFNVPNNQQWEFSDWTDFGP